MSGSLLLAYASLVGSRRRMGAALGMVFVAVVVLDLGLTARSYFVSQVAHDLFKSRGVELLEEVMASPGQWRLFHVRYEREDLSRALPPNTNQVFGLPSMMGTSTISPLAYTDLTDAFEGSGIVVPRLDRQAPLSQVSISRVRSGRPWPEISRSTVRKSFIRR